jgi:hypothetical protein
MGAREHEGGIEVVQELHVVSSVLGRTPFVGLWRTPLPPLLLLPRMAALVWGRGSRQEFAPRSATRGLVCLTLTRVEAVLKACNASLGPRGREHQFFRYKGVQRGFERPWLLRRLRKEELHP